MSSSSNTGAIDPTVQRPAQLPHAIAYYYIAVSLLL